MKRHLSSFFNSFKEAEIPQNAELLDGKPQRSSPDSIALSEKFNSAGLVETVSEEVAECYNFEDESKVNSGLKRNLGSRHIQMIAIGGSIGTGLFVGSGKAFFQGGPASVLLNYIICSILILCTMYAMGELSVQYPVQGSFTVFISRFLDESMGFALGWNYGFQWLIVLPLELTAAGIVISYWDSTISTALYITLFLLIILVINIFGVRGYGEVEFICSAIKSISVIVFIFISIVIICGGTSAGYLGTKTWEDPGAFRNGFKGFCSVFVVAAFSFNGTELVALAAAETASPHKALPRAIRQVVYRVVIFYLLSLFLVGLIVPSNDARLLSGSSSYDASASPFVIAANIANIKVLPDIINAVILISVLSVGNSAVYGCTRSLAALASRGLAPRKLGYIDRKGRPIVAIGLALLFGCLSYVQLAKNGSLIFDWLMALASLCQLIIWTLINVIHIRFRKIWKKAGHTLEDLAWYSPLGVAGSVVGATIGTLAIIAVFYVAISPIGQPSSAEAFFKQTLSGVIILIFIIGHRIYNRGKGFVKEEDIDIMTGRRNVSLEQVRQERVEAKQKWQKLSLMKKILSIF